MQAGNINNDPDTCPVCGTKRSRWLGESCSTCLLGLGLPEPAAAEPAGDPGEASRALAEVVRRSPRWGDYELEEEIARGGMGIVYRARQISLNRQVAVKVLIAGRFANPTFLERFRREAEAAASLTHPNIIAIHDVGAHEGQPYFSMELVEGRSLTELARDQPLGGRRAAQLLKTIAEAVHFAHGHGVLHRDLKPSNVLVDAFDVPHITDFGLAKKVESGGELRFESGSGGASSAINPQLDSLSTESTDLTLTGQVLGSPNYMPPEQADPKRGPTTVASDVYSLGAILYHLLAGRPPFLADSVTQTLRLVAEGEPVSPRLLNPALSRDLETICLKCLEPDAQRRYGSAQALADELGRFLCDEPIRARPVGPLGRLARWRRRKPALAASLGAGGLLLLVVIVGLPVALVRIERARETAEAARQQEAVLRLRAEAAERTTEAQLYTALLEQARVTVRSGDLGQRVRAMAALKRAAAISNSVELRREVFAALALPDLRLERETPHGLEFTLRKPDPNFERIALARGQGPVEVRALADDRLLATLPRSTNYPANDAEWSADGRFLAIKRDYPPDGYRADWEIWEVAAARLLQILQDVPVGAVAFHPTLPRVIHGTHSNHVLVSELEGGAELARFTLSGLPYFLRYAPDGSRIAVVQQMEKGWLVSVHDATNGSRLASQINSEFIHDVQWHPGGQWLAIPDNDGEIKAMDAGTGAVEVIGRHRAQAVAVAFSPDGAWLVTGGWERELICWDARTRRRAFNIGLDSFVARFRADGQACAVVRASGIQWYHCERPTGYREFAEDLGLRLRHGAFSDDGRWLAVSSNQRAGVWDLAQAGPGALAPDAFEAQLDFTADGSELLACRNRDNEGVAFRWRLMPAKQPGEAPVLQRLPIHQPEGFSSLSLRTNSVVMTSSNGSQVLALTQLESGSDQWTKTYPGINRVSPDGRWLGVYRPYTTGVLVYQLPGFEFATKLNHPANVGGIAFSPHQNELAVYSSRRVALWNMETWQHTRTLTNFSRILYSADPHAFWLEQEQRSAGLYDAQTQEPLLLLPAGMLPLALSKDGQKMAVKVDGHRLQVWDLAEIREQLRGLGLDWSESR